MGVRRLKQIRKLLTEDRSIYERLNVYNAVKLLDEELNVQDRSAYHKTYYQDNREKMDEYNKEYEEEEPTEYMVSWHNEEYEDCEFIEAEDADEALAIAEEMIGDELPEDAVIDSVKVA